MSQAKDGLLNALAELSPKRSHNRGDPSRTILDDWADSADVITERLEAIVNEAFLQTARSRRWLRPLFAALVVVAVGIACRRHKRQTTTSSEG